MIFKRGNTMDNNLDKEKAQEMSTSLAEQTEQDIRSRMKDGLMKCSQCCDYFQLAEMHITSWTDSTVIHHASGNVTTKLKPRNLYLCRHCRPKQSGGC